MKIFQKFYHKNISNILKEFQNFSKTFQTLSKIFQKQFKNLSEIFDLNPNFFKNLTKIFQIYNFTILFKYNNFTKSLRALSYFFKKISYQSLLFSETKNSSSKFSAIYKLIIDIDHRFSHNIRIIAKFALKHEIQETCVAFFNRIFKNFNASTFAN